MRFKNEIKKLSRNIGIFTVGSIGSRIIVYLLTPIYTLYMSTSDYGLADIYYTTIQILVPILTLRISSASFRFSMEYSEKRKGLLSNAVLVCVSSSICLILLYTVAYYVFDLIVSPIVFTLLFLLISIHEVLAQFTKSIGKNKLYVLNSLLTSVSMLGLNYYFLAIAKLGILGFYYGLIIANAISCVFLLLFCGLYKYIRIRSIEKELLIKMIAYAIPLVPAAISFWVIQASDRYMVLFFMGSSSAGVYSIAYKIPNICGALVNIFSQAWEISAIQNKDYPFFRFMYRRYYYLVIVASSMLMVLSKPISMLLFKSDFSKAYYYVLPLIVSYVFSYIQTFFESIFISLKETRKLMKSVVIGAIANVVMNAVLIPLIGVYGAIIATGLSYVIVLIVRIRFLLSIQVLEPRCLRDFWMVLTILIQMCLCYAEMYILCSCVCILLVVYSLKTFQMSKG